MIFVCGFLACCAACGLLVGLSLILLTWSRYDECEEVHDES